MKTVVYATNINLPCACDPENTVVLCLTSSDLVAPSLCPHSAVEESFPFTTIEATILKVYQTQITSCGRICKGYNYVFSYDEAQLADSATALTAAQISGAFCKGCDTTWAEQLVGNEIVVTDNGNNTATLTTQHGCAYVLQTGLSEMYIFPETYGALGDGSHDDAPAIQDAIDFVVAAGQGVIFFSTGKTYFVESKLEIPITARNMQLLGYGAAIRAGDIDDNILQIADTTTTNNAARDITIAGLTIIGTGPLDTVNANQCGIEIDAVIRCVLRDVQILNIPKTGIIGTKSTASGSAYWNKVSFENVSVRFCGFQGLYIGTASAVDDLVCSNCIFNHCGEQIVSNFADGSSYIKAISLVMTGCEVSGNYSNTPTFGYRWGLSIQTASGVLSGMHFELNGYDQVGSADLFIDALSKGLVVSGSNHYGSDVTGAKFCIQTKGTGTIIQDVAYAGNGTHQYDYVVEAGSAVAVQIGPICSLTATPIGVLEVNLGGFGAGTIVTADNYTITGRRKERLQTPYASSNPAQIVLAGWGTSATVTAVKAFDSAGDFTVNAAGGGQTNPATITITFADGDWPDEPVCFMYQRTTGGGGTLLIPQVAISAHRILFTANSAPIDGTTYTFSWQCIGR